MTPAKSPPPLELVSQLSTKLCTKLELNVSSRPLWATKDSEIEQPFIVILLDTESHLAFC